MLWWHPAHGSSAKGWKTGADRQATVSLPAGRQRPTHPQALPASPENDIAQVQYCQLCITKSWQLLHCVTPRKTILVFLEQLGDLGLILANVLAHNLTPSCGTSNSELKSHSGARNSKQQVHPPGTRPYIAELRPFSASVLRISASMAACGKSNYCRNRRGLKFDWPANVLRISASVAAHSISCHIAAQGYKAWHCLLGAGRRDAATKQSQAALLA